jgi:hypothetical protein
MSWQDVLHIGQSIGARARTLSARERGMHAILTEVDMQVWSEARRLLGSEADLKITTALGVGATWTEASRPKTGLLDDVSCCFCGAHALDARHVLFHCPEFQYVRDQHFHFICGLEFSKIPLPILMEVNLLSV